MYARLETQDGISRPSAQSLAQSASQSAWLGRLEHERHVRDERTAMWRVVGLGVALGIVLSVVFTVAPGVLSILGV